MMLMMMSFKEPLEGPVFPYVYLIETWKLKNISSESEYSQYCMKSIMHLFGAFLVICRGC